jgi:hypothetical protein
MCIYLGIDIPFHPIGYGRLWQVIGTTDLPLQEEAQVLCRVGAEIPQERRQLLFLSGHRRWQHCEILRARKDPKSFQGPHHMHGYLFILTTDQLISYDQL